jgi:hypothetical protein
VTGVEARLGVRPWHALVVALVLEVALVVASQGDIPASDPLWYAARGYRIALDPSEAFAAPTIHPFDMRIGLTVPLAGLYRAFGVSTPVTDLPCLLAALVILMVIYAAAPSPRGKLIGLVLGVASTTLVREASLLNVDLPCAALMACSILWLSRRDRPHGSWWLIAAIGAWFAAFLVKETALWCIPVWLYAIGCDLRGASWRTVSRSFAPAIAVGVVLAASYLALCAHVWGDAWARFAGVEELTNDHRWSMNHSSTGAWIRRLVWQPPLLFCRMFWVTLIPALSAAWLVRGRERLWWVATTTIALLFWFGSSSAKAYAPLPILPRMAIPVLPGVLVLATLATDQLLDRLRTPRRRRAVVGGLLAAVVVPSAISIGAMIARDRPESAAYAALHRDVADPARNVVLVCADPRCPAISAFYFGFQPPPNLKVAFAPDFADAPLPGNATVRAVVNMTRRQSAREIDPRGDRVDEIEAARLPPITWHRDVRLYDAGDGARLHELLRAR